MPRLCFRARYVLAVFSFSMTACAPRAGASARAPSAAAAGYIAYVASEASDIVSRIRFVPGTPAVVEKITGVGEPGKIAGPHGIALSEDGRFWFVSLSHAVPTGRVARYSTGADTLTRSINVGAFPETIARDADYIFVTNSEAAGSRAVSGVSILFAPTMTEVARPSTCVRPQGGRIGQDARHYSVCEASDQLVVIDTRTLRLAQRFSLTPGQERILDVNARGGAGTGGGRGDRSAAGAAGRGGRARCAPTWVEPGRGPRAGSVYVACSRSNEILEIDNRMWTVTRRIPMPSSPHRLAADSAGRILYASLHEDSAIAAIDLATATVRGRVATSQAAPHAIVITRDGAYAFVSNEGSGTARGTVDILDLATFKRVSSVEVGYGAGALDVMQVRAPRR